MKTITTHAYRPKKDGICMTARGPAGLLWLFEIEYPGAQFILVDEARDTVVAINSHHPQEAIDLFKQREKEIHDRKESQE